MVSRFDCSGSRVKQNRGVAAATAQGATIKKRVRLQAKKGGANRVFCASEKQGENVNGPGRCIVQQVHLQPITQRAELYHNP